MATQTDPNQLAAVREGYNRWAAVYDHDRNPLQALEEPIVRQAVGDVRHQRVLDLGCGTGRHAAWLASEQAVVTALDFSEEMLAVARSKPGAEAIRYRSHDLHEPLPLAGGEIDLVVSGLVLEHLGDLASFFREVHRVLRPSGRAVVSAMHPAMFLRESQARFTDPESGEVVQPGSLPHQLSEMTMAALGAGFLIEGIREYAPNAEFAAQFPRAQKYIDWPMLVVLELRAARDATAG
jgi:malonyl-CoA O-methyltransferase